MIKGLFQTCLDFDAHSLTRTGLIAGSHQANLAKGCGWVGLGGGWGASDGFEYDLSIREKSGASAWYKVVKTMTRINMNE